MYKLFTSYKETIKNGYSLDAYKTNEGMTEVGSIVQLCKYHTYSDFPQRLIDITKENVDRYVNVKFDYIMFIPPTVSGDKLKNFVESLSKELNIPVKQGLNKLCASSKRKFCVAQKYLKLEKEKQEIIFSCVKSEEIKDKNILLIDDVCCSGQTIQSAGKFLMEQKAKTVVPLVLSHVLNGGIKYKLIT